MYTMKFGLSSSLFLIGLNLWFTSSLCKRFQKSVIYFKLCIQTCSWQMIHQTHFMQNFMQSILLVVRVPFGTAVPTSLNNLCFYTYLHADIYPLIHNTRSGARFTRSHSFYSERVVSLLHTLMITHAGYIIGQAATTTFTGTRVLECHIEHAHLWHPVGTHFNQLSPSPSLS